MQDVRFYDEVDDRLLKFAVIFAKFDNKWVFCKHKMRDTFEAPGGHREPGEHILDTAKRELYEETGAVDFEIAPICAYSYTGRNSVIDHDEETFGMLYFAKIKKIGELPDSEIEKIIIQEEMPTSWTYAFIQPILIKKVQEAIADKTVLVDEGILQETKNRSGRKKYIVNKTITAIASFIIILIVFALFSLIPNKSQPRVAGGEYCGTLPGANEIYPAVMYQGKIFYWKQMAGPVTKLPQGVLPEGYEYAGDIKYNETGELTDDLQFTAIFEGTGKLYYNVNDPDNICVCLTSYWLEDAYVIFSSSNSTEEDD